MATKIGPKYKIARRLGAGVFEKTQTQKFALSQARRGKKEGGRGPKSDFGVQMLEKQKARFSYALTERQFSKYVKQALAKKGSNAELLYGQLESRLDNVALRGGFGHTRLLARQIVSHGHLLVNGKRVNIPSYQVRVGDKIELRPGSVKKPQFAGIEEKLKNTKAPSWLAVDAEKKVITVQGAPKLNTEELIFDMSQVLEFYSR